ncbi:MAG: response regulator transcription factor [Bacteroidia bacterium]|jgi:DNA-binding LytR/AlgR family response regulator|nr:response regulator transcription factor [Bacteroidota bacterium]MBP6640872.1 response regulator transcription factor [Bacteroidia bacterium]
MAMNCVIVDDDSLSVRLLEGLIAQTESLVHTRSFSSAVEAVNFLRENAVDILFLDVEMPGMTGLELLGALETKPAVILVSSKAEYAVDGFQFDVEDFLLKPLTYARFLKAVKKVEDKFNQDQAVQFKGDYVFVKSDTALVKVDIRQLMWVEALADYVALVTKEKKYVCHSTMKSIESKLPADQFVRVHRSYIVRIDQIDAIEDKTVSVGKKIIPVGGTYRDSLMNRLNLI